MPNEFRTFLLDASWYFIIPFILYAAACALRLKKHK